MRPKVGMTLEMTGTDVPTSTGEVTKVNGGCMTVEFPDSNIEADFTIGRLADGVQYWNEAITGAEVVFTAVQPQKVEAHGVKGMGSHPWRRTFKSTGELNKWVQEHDATVYGVREVK